LDNLVKAARGNGHDFAAERCQASLGRSNDEYRRDEATDLSVTHCGFG
jgi:hypothetical protein